MAYKKGFVEAIREVGFTKKCRVRLVDGSIVKGSILDIQSAVNDPDGIGYFTLIDRESGACNDVYSDEFGELLETW